MPATGASSSPSPTLVRYRRMREKLVKRISEAHIPSPYGEFTAHTYRSVLDGTEHLALVKGKVAGESDVLVGGAGELGGVSHRGDDLAL